jgi:ring-1,2-phenylacetyl-CoA epoxidase subunit PaaD
MVMMKTLEKDYILSILEKVSDPEIPVLSVIDMGIIRDVKIADESVEIIITPTYSGCPAMNMIELNLKSALEAEGIHPVKITTILSPPWTTDWMSESGKSKLKAYGIAPPQDLFNRIKEGEEYLNIPCPQCNSTNTVIISEFGSTPCKALLRCKDCLEPFDYFKCH